MQEKGRLSFFYDRNWKPFQLFVRKRFPLPRGFMRNIYDESFRQLAMWVKEKPDEANIPLKIRWFRQAIELIHQSDKGKKELADTKAFEEEWQQQEHYIGIYRLVRDWLAEREDKQDIPEEEVLACVRKVAEGIIRDVANVVKDWQSIAIRLGISKREMDMFTGVLDGRVFDF